MAIRLSSMGTAQIVSDFLDCVTDWAAHQPTISAVPIVGSHVRGEARSDSDMDLVLLYMRHVIRAPPCSIASLPRPRPARSHAFERDSHYDNARCPIVCTSLCSASVCARGLHQSHSGAASRC